MFKRFFSKKKEVETIENISSEEKNQFTEEVETNVEVETEEKKEENKFEPNKIDWLINDSILTFMPRELYMHYWDNNTEKNLQDPSWQNQGVYFWNNNEPFERKSLPDFFENFEKKLFVFHEVPDYISLVSAKAIPWFGMPGEGDKFCLRYDDHPITLEEAHKLNIIKYVEIIELNYENLGVLNDRDNYCFLIDPKEVTFENQLFYLNGEKISLAELYQKKKLLVLSVQ
ncbi:hypothetical protein SGQ44_01815 [Flavobacterium sp. Fl-77]|uniref:Uncharacterized protein n=1 Tax=Flavobacterium flavipigmentatum TaxID=2893884 RepID=A0AAJ2S8I5_9FLAO|nr:MULTISPECIES: hypothetical protein [unclassified Flavobacterium]MDX6180873.1 hypothetical protein [Flavobacterium sp. Fl-33]MDX6184474.1 hypothetical protein [Flavobacterium sp. Fl-77]UFH39582.1 hypothetical protein LNP22_04710 [Flavobacterium sp. F-70]